ncbi:hypothetical protein J5N97_019333 [Dioscorea zingiberensis]|uniref:RRM domain-containing protein n=1 Tax=Dioscorea zingiberensis TaxID=325984 RepID=A0A9D5HCD5_9LILI|nr:hypothetical protein J5N97_019333 [Dioscorea zingiberensis]
MEESYGRHPSLDGRDAHGAFPGYFPLDASSLANHHLLGISNPPPAASEILYSNALPLRSGGYPLNDLAGVSTPAAPGISGLPSGANIRSFSPLEDPALVRRDVSLGMDPGTTEIERPNPLRIPDGLSDNESNVLYVDGLPADCTRREVSHLFRPFIGFKEIRVVHKEPRRAGEKAQVLCFVEFKDAKCAFTALEALQGYKFDDKKPDSPILRIQFAKFPFHPPGYGDRRRALLRSPSSPPKEIIDSDKEREIPLSPSSSIPGAGFGVVESLIWDCGETLGSGDSGMGRRAEPVSRAGGVFRSHEEEEEEEKGFTQQ